MNNIKNVQVLGSGCPSCKKLYELAQKAVDELDLKVKVEYITDIQKIISMGFMQSPIMTVNDKPILIGQVPSLERIKELLINNKPEEEKVDDCSCGGNC